MSDHDHVGSDIATAAVAVFIVAVCIFGVGGHPCPPNSAPMSVWYWPPIQCVQIAEGPKQ